MHDDDELTQERDRLSGLFGVADEIIDAGFDCFPAAVWVKDDGSVAKAPLMRNGHLGAHRDRQLIRQQIINPPHVPLGVPEEFEVVVAFIPGSGGCGVLDCDVKHGKEGREALKELTRLYGDFYKAAWRSPSGGVNILFDKPPATSYGNASPWAGIDVRADNGWVVAPGNVCAAGSWTWKLGGFTTAAQLPDAMAGQLTAAATHGRKASNAETVAFVEASPETSSLPAMHAFDQELKRFRSAASGSRHDALVRIVSWACGMNALDLRWAVEKIKDEWLALTSGEGREDEVTDVLTWVVGQEVPKRASAPPLSGTIDAYQPSASATDSDDDEMLSLVDWTTSLQQTDALVDEFLFLGRWVQIAAPAKAGKSSLEMFVAIELSEGRDPFDGHAIDPVPVLYVDGEMGQRDLEQLIRDCGHDPQKLANLYCSTERCRLDTPGGAQRLLRRASMLGAQLVLIDGLNGFVSPDASEKDDTTWRRVYDYAVQGLKDEGMALLSGDNLGKDTSLGPRGSSVKMDKADAVVKLKRLEDGVMLKTTHARAGIFLDEVPLECEGHDRSKPIRYWRTRTGGFTAEAFAAAKVLDRLGVPVSMGRPKVRALLKAEADKAIAAGRDPSDFQVRNATLTEALRARRVFQKPGTTAGTGLFSDDGTGDRDTE